MPAGEVHYEIHAKPPKGKWKFYGAVESREAAEKQANDLVKEKYSVRVTKETLNPEDGNFISNRIFHSGDKDFEVRTGKTNTTEPLPCFKPQDLYSFQARKTIGDLLQYSLNHWRITPLELLHSPANLERLESTGTVLQAAIQKMAIAQSQAGEGSVAERVKTLHKLVSDGMKTVYVDRDKNRIPVITKANVDHLIEIISRDPRREYLFNAAIAAYLEDSPDWNTKLDRILELIQTVPEESLLKEFSLRSIDGFVAEIMTASSAIKDMIGPQPDLENALQRLAELFCGKLAADVTRTSGVTLLNAMFALGELPQSRTAIARRILKELEGRTPLTAGSLDGEVKALRRLGTQMTIGCGNLIPHEEILNAFRVKSGRLLSNTTLEAFLGNTKNPAERAEKILFLGENVVGQANKHKLTNILRSIINDAAFGEFFASKTEPVTSRLRQLTGLQDKLLASEIDAERKQELSDKVDGICLALLETNRVLQRLCDGQPSPVGKSLALLKFVTSGMVTRGGACERTQNMAIKFLSQPGVLQSYLTAPQDADMLGKMQELAAILDEAGINPDSVLKAAAAKSA